MYKEIMNVKKLLPFILVIVAGILVVGGIFIVKKITQPATTDTTSQDDATVPELPDSEKPVAALVPTADGHYLTLKVDGIKVPGASSMDYDMLWKTNNAGVEATQGTSSTFKLDGQTSFNKDLLLGSESSGKFRYDKGVETGTLTLRFRDGNGKLLGKVTTDFRLQTGTTALSSVDGSFKYTLTKAATGVYFVTMQSFGTADPAKVVVFSNGWAVYASDGLAHPGTTGN